MAFPPSSSNHSCIVPWSTPVFGIEQFGSTVPQFVFLSVSWLSCGPSSSETSFQKPEDYIITFNIACSNRFPPVCGDDEGSYRGPVVCFPETDVNRETAYVCGNRVSAICVSATWEALHVAYNNKGQQHFRGLGDTKALLPSGWLLVDIIDCQCKIFCYLLQWFSPFALVIRKLLF